MSDTNKRPLTGIQERFILHWGEMGTRWGVNRTVAQIHALLYLSPKPLNAEEICATLSATRSHVSTSLRELQSWGIVKRVRVLGDRRDHFESLKDVWEMFARVVEERKRREMDPTLAMLREAAAELKKAGSRDKETEARIEAMLEFFTAASTWFGKLKEFPVSKLAALGKSGGGLWGLQKARLS
jgi:DNA-binding transcriptional regulator GbsR (MarR family)